MRLLDYLRRGFETLDEITKDEFDSLLDRIKLYHTTAMQNSSLDELQQLIGLTSHYYGLSGTKLAQIYAIKTSLERQLERRRSDIARENNLPLLEKTAIERLCWDDTQYVQLRSQVDEATSVELYFKYIREAFYMYHYSLRNKTDLVNSSGSGQRYQINHGGI